MSVIIVVDPNTGEIKEMLHGTISYRSPNGVTIKPTTKEELARYIKISENAKHLRKLREEIENFDKCYNEAKTNCDQAAMEKASRDKRAAAEEIQRKENFEQASNTIQRLQKRAAELEKTIFTITTTAGKEEIELELDEYTDHAFSEEVNRLNRLSAAFQSDEPENVKKAMQQLVEIEEALEAMPRRARDNYVSLLMRQELAQAVIERLENAGWSVRLETEGDANKATKITAQNAIGDCASIVFACDDQIYLETPGFSESTRSALQQLVMGTLHDSGAVKAVATCLGHQHPIDPNASRQEKKAASAEKRVQVR